MLSHLALDAHRNLSLVDGALSAFTNAIHLKRPIHLLVLRLLACGQLSNPTLPVDEVLPREVVNGSAVNKESFSRFAKARGVVRLVALLHPRKAYLLVVLAPGVVRRGVDVEAASDLDLDVRTDVSIGGRRLVELRATDLLVARNRTPLV